MSKVFFKSIVSVMTFPFLFFSIQVTPPQVLIDKLIDKNGKITEALYSLCQLTDINLTDRFDRVQLGEETQDKWYQGQQGKVERWNFAVKWQAKRDKIIPLLKTLGLIDAVRAKQLTVPYHFALINGAKVASMQSRIDFLIEEYKRGVRFKKVILLSSNRALENDEKLAILTKDNCQTEADAIEYLWRNAKGLPQKVKENFVLVCAEGTPQKRATTVDTWKKFIELKLHSSNDRFISVSSNPYIDYQAAESYCATKNQKIHIETIGPGANLRAEKIVVQSLDSIARCLYTIEHKIGYETFYPSQKSVKMRVA